MQKFKSYAAYEGQHRPLKPGEFSTQMPWVPYAHLSEQDLGAIHTYLHSLKPVKHKVEKWGKADPKLVAVQ